MSIQISSLRLLCLESVCNDNKTVKDDHKLKTMLSEDLLKDLISFQENTYGKALLSIDFNDATARLLNLQANTYYFSDIPPNTTIKKLREMMNNKGITFFCTLYMNGLRLEDNKALTEYGVRSGSIGVVRGYLP